MGSGGVAHLFVIYGYHGAENDPDRLAHAVQLLTPVLAEAKMCCSGQPVMLVVDLNADPMVIGSLANGMADGAWIDVELPFADGRGVSPAPTCQFPPDEGKGTRRDFVFACSIALAAATACQVLPERWFSPHFAVRTDSSIVAWDATVEMAKVYFTLLACLFQAVQNMWDAHIQELSCVSTRSRIVRSDSGGVNSTTTVKYIICSQLHDSCYFLSIVVLRYFGTWMEAGLSLVCRKEYPCHVTPVPVLHQLNSY